MKYLTIEFKRDYVSESMKFHSMVSKGNRGVSYIAGWVCMKSEDIEIIEMTGDYISFNFNGKEYKVEQGCIDRVRLEKIGEEK